jgi:putative drug exporter of the RND superfamily
MSRRQRIVAGLRTALARFRALDRSDRVRLIAFGVAVAVLSPFRLGATDRMHASDVVIPGTKSAEARDVSDRSFGVENQLMVLLRGSPGALDRQGPRIVASIERLPGHRVLDPWRAGGRELRPKPGAAELLIAVEKPFDSVARHDSERLRVLLDREVKPPLRASLTGFAEINRAITEESIHSVTIGELAAAPILVILLLWIFGTPIAAAMPLFLGGSAAFAGAGLLDLINRFVLPLESTSITLGTVAALALGVDYSLLLVARFRSELAAGASVREASDIALARAGRTVKFAAGTLAAAMLTALVVAPASVLKSATVGILSAVLLSVIGATVALPPLLRLAGRDINRFQVFPPAAESRRWGGLAAVALRRPVVATAAVLAVIALLAIPVLSLQTGPPDPRILPDSSSARADFETVVDELGGGQAMPFIVTVVARRGTLADERLKQLAAFERELRRDPQTAQVLGPATIAKRAAELATVPRRLRRAQAAARRGERGAARLEDGLARAAGGGDQLVAGLGDAVNGSQQLHDGHARVARGAAQLDAGAGAAHSGGERVSDGLARALAGVRTFADGSRRASDGAGRIAGGIALAQRRAQASAPAVSQLVGSLDGAAGALRHERDRAGAAAAQAAAALQAVEQMQPSAKADPSYQSAHAALASAAATLGGLPGALEQGAAETARAADAARGLRDDVETLGTRLAGLAGPSSALEERVSGLTAGDDALQQRAQDALADANGLEQGLARSADRTGALTAGAQALGAGSGRLVSSLGADASRAAPLAGGLDGAHGGAVRLRRQAADLASGLGETRRFGRSFRSGYATIAGIKSTSRSQQAAAAWAINHDRGSSAVRFLVSSRNAVPTRAGDPYRPHLEGMVQKLAKRIGATAVVGGPSTQLADFDRSARGSLPLLVLMLTVVAYIALVPMMRSLILPLIAVVLNVLTLLAAFGVLALAFGPNPLLGGPGFVDAIMVIVIFTVTFGLSLDYAIFILDRMREGFDRTRSVDGAISYGIEGTAGILTGAAAIMAGVFLAFALASPIVSLRQVGVGLAVAVILDATLLRLVLLPAVVLLAGERAWHVPQWIEALSERLSRAPREPGAEQPEAGQA